MTTASPTKLRDGSWGARVPGVAQQGQAIHIQTRAGKSWDAEVSRVLWTGSDREGQTVSLCSTRTPQRSSGGYSRSMHDSGYCGYPCPVTGRKCCPANGPCHDCE